jgi:Pyridoxamine 5'-phosphate oxidase
MDRQDVSRELGQPGARELLESATMARLAYNGPDGLPRVIPIGFYWNGERIVVCTATTSPKVQALSARPDVAITIDTGSARSRGSAPHPLPGRLPANQLPCGAPPARRKPVRAAPGHTATTTSRARRKAAAPDMRPVRTAVWQPLRG